jgi:putative redox protein
MKIKTTWIKDEVFDSNQHDHHVTLDGSVKEGFSPKALLLAGLGACSGIDVVDILKKMRVSFNAFYIETSAHQTEEYPRVFKEIDIIYHIHTDPVNEEKVRKAIELSLDKYCGVSAMLKKNSPIKYLLKIEP